MKQLVKGSAPDFFTKFITHKQPKSWEDMGPIRQELREHILTEQRDLCAYTEVYLSGGDSCHIDHYHTRNLFPEETFSYDNMLVSCNSEIFGAKYKDKQIKEKADYEDLINPLEEDPTNYLEFTFTGDVVAVDTSTKGEKTISVFNLNEKSLVERRKIAALNLASMMDSFTEEDMVGAIGEFETMIRQLYREVKEESNSIDGSPV